MKIFIPGANGFIGSHLIEQLLSRTPHQVTALDLRDNNLKALNSSKFFFQLGDIFTDNEILEKHIADCDVAVILAGVAKPSMYLSNPLFTFELDFEQNLKLVRMCVKHNKRVIFPSTSEVYGLSSDDILLEDESPLIVGPINKMRWIYSCGKQMMDRVITAYGVEKGLRYTIFRPFNWVGPRLDTIEDAEKRSARSITQMIFDILNRGEISLVGGGEQRRSFTWIDDGVDALIRIIENKDGKADGEIFNIGNPANNYSIKELAEIIRSEMLNIPSMSQKAREVKFQSVEAEKYYSNGYDDMKNRVPSIEKMRTLLGWEPKTDLRTAVRKTLEAWYAEA